MSKKICKECGGFMDAGIDYDSDDMNPIWTCRCCWKTFPRKIYVVKKRQEKIKLFNEMLEKVLDNN